MPRARCIFSFVPSISGEPKVVSMRCLVAEPGATFPWHSHDFEEFTLVTDDETTIGHPSGKRPAEKNTLFLYHRGESHGSWSSPKQKPRFWVVHFTPGSGFYRENARLGNPDATQRVWQLSPEQVETFKWLFLQILNEHTHRRGQRLVAESAWLTLLLVSVERWAEGETPVMPVPDGISSEVLRLWHVVNACVGNPAEFLEEIRLMPNYDSLRHKFKNAFGCAPREMMLRLRIQQAKNLLLETRLSVKEIATRAGYQRQHEFARAFKQDVGMAPSEWRLNPFQSSITV